MKSGLKKLAWKRRAANKTNYTKRLKLLKSGTARLVVRRTNTKMIAQIINYEPDGDKVVVSSHSTDLKKLGWTGSCKNTPAAYLTGMLIAKKAKEAGIKDAILDLGLHSIVRGSRIFALVKGASDAGLNIPASEKIIPDEERIKGTHINDKISKEFEKVLSKIKV